jgi:hypothetical protein
LSSSPSVKTLKRKGSELFYVAGPIWRVRCAAVESVRWEGDEVRHQRVFDLRRVRRRSSSSPFRETLKRKGVEVLYVADPVDEYAVQQ